MRGCNGNQAKLQRKPKRDVTEITENLNRNLQKPGTERRTRRARLFFFSWHAKAVLQVLLVSVALRDTRGLSASRACRARVEGSGLRAQGKPQNPQPLQPVARISAEQEVPVCLGLGSLGFRVQGLGFRVSDSPISRSRPRRGKRNPGCWIERCSWLCCFGV